MFIFNRMVNYTYDLNLIFHSLADPTRRAVLEQISVSEKRISELIPAVKMSLAAVSKHVKVLEAAGLILRRKQGRESFIRLNQEAMLNADQWISSYTNLWNEQLDALSMHLASQESSGNNPSDQ